jgi:predicted nucleic acid-binding protein
VAKYVVDTNLYIRATRDAEWNQALEAFLGTFTPWVHLHSVVALELLAGAVSPELEQRTRASFIEPFERRGRVITPGAGAWQGAGSAVARLLRDRKLSPDGIGRSFLNDCLIAASARDDGFTLVTDNTADFALLGDLLPIRVVAPWPDPIDAGPADT